MGDLNMKFTIDRFEGNLVVVELENREMINISREILPPDSKEGDILSIEINKAETEKRKKRIQDKFNNLLNNKDGKEGGNNMNLSLTTLYVSDMKESLNFYEEIVGLKAVERFDAGPNVEIAFLGNGETQLELIHDKSKEDIEIGLDISIGFEIDSVDEKISFLKEKNINLEGEIIQPNPNTKFFFILDPNGLRI